MPRSMEQPELVYDSAAAESALGAAANLGVLPELSVPDLVRHAAALGPDSRAIESPDGGVTFRELANRINARCSSAELADISPGTHVAIIGTNSISWVEYALAVLAKGAVLVPVSTRLTDSEMEFIIRHSRSEVCIVASGYRRRRLDRLVERLTEQRRRVIALDQGAAVARLGAGSSEPAAPRIDPKACAVIMYTSGSTALPKGCMLTHQGMIRNAAQHSQRLTIESSDKWFSAMPFFHAGGFVWGLLSCLVTGATLVIQDVFDAGPALTMIEDLACTYQHGVDTMFLAQMSHETFAKRRLRSLRAAASTGSRDVLTAIHEGTGIPGLVSKWGTTEGYGNLTLASPHDPLTKRLATVGRTYPNIEYQIRDLGTGQAGEIVVRGSSMLGYFDDEAATAALIDADGWLHSGDLGYFDDDDYLMYVGRVKEMLKVGGENVSPLEVEGVLMRHPAVAIACVVGMAHPRLQEIPVAVVALQPSATLREDELHSFARQHLADFKVPTAIYVVAIEDVPMTGSGKAERAKVRDLVSELGG